MARDDSTSYTARDAIGNDVCYGYVPLSRAAILQYRVVITGN